LLSSTQGDKPFPSARAKTRGQAITTAVDAAEIDRSRFLKDLKISRIAIGTEEMPSREGENSARMVSTIEITLTKE
jgi:DNA-binding protein Alba